MDRRIFLSRVGALFGGILVAAPVVVQAVTQRRVELLRSPVAGFQYHKGQEIWASLRVGDVLTLVRETENKYDQRAVRVEWQGHKLGYVPRLDNASVCHLLDSGSQRLETEIVVLNVSNNPWERIAFVVHLIV